MYTPNYTYDTFGQLIRENNKSLDKTYVYEYNESGNITGAKVYSYTTGALDGVNPTSTDSYAYDSTVKDRLTAFKGDAITYNSMGYPTKLVDGSTTYTYTWTKGKLTGFTKFSSLGGRHSYTYTYDAYGRRIRKLYTFAPGSQISAVYTTRVTTNYTYDLSGRLIREQVTETDNQLATYQREFVYLYDGDSIVGVVFTRSGTTSTYYFDKNIKGDVVGIFNSSGTQVAKYTYDAWGKSTLTTLVSNNFSGYNSIRYRGYYYDTETGFYFLNSRYYSPEWRRFIQPAGASSLNPDSVNGLNLYCYAGNNPVGVAYSGFSSGSAGAGGMVSSIANSVGGSSLGGLSNSFNIFDGLNWPQLNFVDLTKDVLVGFSEVVDRLVWSLTKDGHAFSTYHYVADGVNGYTLLDNLPSTSAKIFKNIGIGLMFLDVLEAGYYSYQNGHSFGQGALNVGLNAGKNILIYKVSTRVTLAVGTWAGAKLGASLGSFAGPVGLVAGAVAGAGVGWLIDSFGDEIIEWIVGWFD